MPGSSSSSHHRVPPPRPARPRRPRRPAVPDPAADHPPSPPPPTDGGTGRRPQAPPAGAGNLCWPRPARPALDRPGDSQPGGPAGRLPGRPNRPSQVMTDNDRIPQVLVVDDEPNIRELVQVALKFHGCAVATASTGKDALRQAEAAPPDLIVLDVMLPDLDGFEVCRRLRAAGNDVPVIFLTARDTSSDTVTGLALGGDDYVTKPFSVEALVARVRAVLRRAARNAGDAPADQDILRAGDLELDESRWTVQRAGTPVELSPTEFRLLAYLMRHQGPLRARLA